MGYSVRSLVAASLILIMVCGCASTSSPYVQVYEGEPREKEEIATVYNPNKFIQRIDGNKIFSSYSYVENTYVKVVEVLPGMHTFETSIKTDGVQLASGYQYREWKHKFEFPTEAGHVYYMYEEEIAGVPSILVRDLGKIGNTFDPPLVEEGWSLNEGGYERFSAQFDYDKELEQKGVPVSLNKVE